MSTVRRQYVSLSAWSGERRRRLRVASAIVAVSALLDEAASVEDAVDAKQAFDAGDALAGAPLSENLAA